MAFYFLFYLFLIQETLSSVESKKRNIVFLLELAKCQHGFGAQHKDIQTPSYMVLLSFSRT